MLSSHSLVESVRETEASYLRFDMARLAGLRQMASQIDFATRAAVQAGLKLHGQRHLRHIQRFKHRGQIYTTGLGTLARFTQGNPICALKAREILRFLVLAMLPE
jgi:hypothetical protein